ncbi:sensor histidine kinase [Scytonema sp. UIC 10036]|uniref:sensor histidine kinase n=1 Tax=Scytonema sp. UIC 10036 TaxID=2304196 RepID=UPI0012DA3C97|nr:HAMP domain-containing sensor histidine kinase [Scytonema sp. UIC 10036]MUH01428.1 sensor histidine kinase [Scytonema sp. UIC 10036]
MNWSNWVFLGIGIALGFGIRRLSARRDPTSSSSVGLSYSNQNAPALLQQIKQTQMAYYMAREMSQFKAGFLARTTHVLRSPLNGLIGLHQLILSNLCENPEEEREFIAQAHERALKLLKLIDEILNVARIEYGTNKLNIQPLSLVEILQQLHEVTYMLAENRNYPFLMSPPDPEIYVLADPYWLRYVLVSLVESSITQMEEGSLRISVGGSPTDNLVSIWLDVPTHAIPLQEQIDLIATDNKFSQQEELKSSLSPGMKLLLNQTLIEVMAGKLEVFASPADSEPSSSYTRLQVSIPRVIPEVEL